MDHVRCTRITNVAGAMRRDASHRCKEHAHYMGVSDVRGMHCSIPELERT
jgi:hypothetical protein